MRHKKYKKRLYILVSILLVILLVGILSLSKKPAQPFEELQLSETGEVKEPGQDRTKKIVQDVPFTRQAPFGDWDDARQQDGCEEASALMAVKWARDEKLTLAEAKTEILNMSDTMLAKYGNFHDTSADDTAERLFREYLGYENIEVKHQITTQDIIDELYKGNIIALPLNGQKLDNPNFTAPGPQYHFLVIIGYNPDKKLFITNDPGTRKGEGYTYPEEIMQNALQDYPTGFHEPQIPGATAMIVVSKE